MRGSANTPARLTFCRQQLQSAVGRRCPFKNIIYPFLNKVILIIVLQNEAFDDFLAASVHLLAPCRHCLSVEMFFPFRSTMPRGHSANNWCSMVLVTAISWENRLDLFAVSSSRRHYWLSLENRPSLEKKKDLPLRLWEVMWWQPRLIINGRVFQSLRP